MINKVISYSINNKLVIALFTALIVGFGIYAILHISVGAMPDVTTNQVQIITTSRNLSTEDIEKFITYPVEMEMANLPGVTEVRSISKFGLSVVTVVFEESMGTYLPRQLISEKLASAKDNIPEKLGTPKLGPISTGLGEIYQYTLEVKPGYEDKYSSVELRTIQDWIVKRQLAGMPGVVEINTWGGKLKQYEIAIIPSRLNALDVSLEDIHSALVKSNENAGAAYIEKGDDSYFIRTEGILSSIGEIGSIVVDIRNGTPLLIRDIAEVRMGYANRFGAVTANGQGEKVMGQIMMLKGANSSEVIKTVKQKIEEIQKNLPEGILINGFLERSVLIKETVSTVKENLILGALIVIFVLVLLMGNLRSGFIVASVIPLSMLFGLSLMYIFGMEVNLMSLGAIDFGILIDGAVIIVEYTVFLLTTKAGELSNHSKSSFRDIRDKIAYEASGKMMNSAFFGQLIILIVFIPIVTLTGIEGKMFKPMAFSFGFMLIGAVILCLTYVPMMSSAFLSYKETGIKRFSDKLVFSLRHLYDPVFEFGIANKKIVITSTIVFFFLSLFIFTRIGGEFLPTLDEGDFVIQPVLKPGTSLSKTIEISTAIENKLLESFPEVTQVVTRIGAAEIPTDPMSMEMTDVIVKLKPKKEWVSAQSKDELANKMKKELSLFPGIEFEFTQPIEMRFNELISGVRSDVAIKLFGEDLTILSEKGNEIKNLIHDLDGVSDISVEKVTGLPQVKIKYRRTQLSKYGLSVSDINEHIQAAFAGLPAGIFFEGERLFDIVIRYHPEISADISLLNKIIIDTPGYGKIPLSEVAQINLTEGPAQISRENTQRRIVIGINIRNRDMQSLVNEIDGLIQERINLPEGYYVTFGGQFENLNRAKKRLSIAAPVALALIFVLLFFTFRSVTETMIVFAGVPLSAIGGILALYIRGMPFSISAGIGFIALFGIAVLNGIVLISYFNDLYKDGVKDVIERVRLGTKNRFRPVILTAATDILGFLPMAISTSAGAEVQRPLATVVIGGLISSFFLTLIIIPVLYIIFEKKIKIGKGTAMATALAFFVMLGAPAMAQDVEEIKKSLSLENCLQIAVENNKELEAAKLRISRQKFMEKAAWDLGATRFFYSTEEHQKRVSSSGIASLGIQQNFSFPTKYISQTKLKQAETSVITSEYHLEVIELKNKVAHAYNELQFAARRVRYLALLDSLYGQLSATTGRRYNSGDISYLEMLSSRARFNEIHTRFMAANEEEKQAKTHLRSLLFINEPFDIEGDEQQFDKYEVNKTGNEYPMALQDYMMDRDAYFSQKIRVYKNDYFPDFNIQYFEQWIDNSPGYNGFQIGLDIPVFYNVKKSNVNAAKVEKEINNSMFEAEKSRFDNEMSRLNMELLKQEDLLKYYEDTGNPLADEIFNTAHKSFDTGEISYFQFVQSINEAVNIKVNHLEALLKYNATAIEINFYYKSLGNETY